jgi:hypothetical protein
VKNYGYNYNNYYDYWSVWLRYLISGLFLV